MAKIQTIKARVLSDYEALKLKCEQLVSGPEKVIKALESAGAVCAHPDSVAYAESQGATEVELEDPKAAEQFAAAAAEEKSAEGAPADGSANLVA